MSEGKDKIIELESGIYRKLKVISDNLPLHPINFNSEYSFLNSERIFS